MDYWVHLIMTNKFLFWKEYWNNDYIRVNSILENHDSACLSTLYNVATKHFYFKISEKKVENNIDKEKL